MKVILSGGGTAGSVMPLVAIAVALRKQKPDTNFLFIGTKRAMPERAIAQSYNLPFVGIHSAKLRRYLDVRTIIAPFELLLGFVQALVYVGRFRPDIVIGAGGFVSVPVIWAAWVLRKKILIHQQDVRPSLSNILTALFANVITVTVEETARFFPPKKTIATGNPVRQDILEGSRQAAINYFQLDKSLPTLLILGGGTGAQTLNNSVGKIAPALVQRAQVIHILGPEKTGPTFQHPHYRTYPLLLDQMKHVLSVADVIISRAGMSAIGEFAALSKPAILVPLPHTHQEVNADYLHRKKAAIIVHEQSGPDALKKAVLTLLDDINARQNLGKNIRALFPQDATTQIVNKIVQITS